MTIAIARLLDNGVIELTELRDGETWRGTRAPGADLSDLPADVIAATEAHWDADVGGQTRAARFLAAAVSVAAPVDLAPAIKAEARRRIYKIASDDAQKNMMANAIAGNFTADDVLAWKNGVAWIGQMQAAARALIAASDPTYADDSHWPPVPADAAALAARY